MSFDKCIHLYSLNQDIGHLLQPRKFPLVHSSQHSSPPEANISLIFILIDFLFVCLFDLDEIKIE